MDININGFIGDAGFFGGDSFSLKELNAQLANIGTDKEVNVYINSGGGYVTEGFAIYDRLISFANDNGVKVNTVVDRKSTRLNSSHSQQSRMPSSA